MKDKRTLIILDIILGIFSTVLSIIAFIYGTFGKTETIRFLGMYIAGFDFLVCDVVYLIFYCKRDDFKSLPLSLRIISYIIILLPYVSMQLMALIVDFIK